MKLKNKIYDCITFLDSNKLFELRYEILKDYVDYFVICEANFTHTGKKKKYNFNHKKWKKKSNKIIYIKVKGKPKINLNQNNKFEIIKIQIENLFKGISKAKDDDLIMLSDEDEIPNPHKIKLYDFENFKFGIFLQKLYYYKLNIQNLSEAPKGWPGSRITTKKNIKSFFDFKILKLKNKDEPFWKFYKEKSIQAINNGGWHFTYLMTAKMISKKIQNSGHIEFNKKKFTTIENIKKRIDNLRDPFDREAKLKIVSAKKIFKKYIQIDIKKYKNWIK